MFEIYCVTNSELCADDFLTRIDEIAACKINGIILREKTLTKSEYTLLAKEVLSICKKHDVNCILHTHTEIALSLNCKNIHMPLNILKSTPKNILSHFNNIGASCHSLAETKEAKKLGCTYISAGHIFPTQCKMGVKERGTAFLENICSNIDIPVLAIGGIDLSNIHQAQQCGASGCCIMSGFMTVPDTAAYISLLKSSLYL
ncbi:MAG: thiamine phosphate synthase [Clostridia bacterium]|nr:thiamine phosphate synthase [Clostridia bacterium]